MSTIAPMPGELEATRRRLATRFGAQVDAWWERLPRTLDELARRWEIAIAEPVGRGNTSLVLRARTAEGRAAILKLSPDPDLASTEARALAAWAPSGRVPQVWGHDAALGALLLEAIATETPLAESTTGATRREVADLIEALHAAGAPHGFPTLAERVEFVFGHWLERNTAVSRVRLERGRELARTLAADAHAAPVLLHGDLHPGNVLRGAAGLVAIDPRPCIGDAAFDVVDWVLWTAGDPRDWEAAARELGVDPARVWSWFVAFAALLASSDAARGGRRVDALLRVAP